MIGRIPLSCEDNHSASPADTPKQGREKKRMLFSEASVKSLVLPTDGKQVVC